MKRGDEVRGQLKVIHLTETARLKARILELEDEVRGYKQTLAQVRPIVMKHHSDLVDEVIANLQEEL